MAEEVKLNWQTGLLAPLPETSRGFALKLDAHKKPRVYCYGNGRHVVVRSMDNPNSAELFSEHRFKVNVARFSPNGEWVASGGIRKGECFSFLPTGPELRCVCGVFIFCLRAFIFLP